VPKEIMDQLLLEDYLTCLAEDEQGVIWIGTRQSGFAIADSKTGASASSKGMGLPDNFVTKILHLGNGNYWIASNGGGIVMPVKPFKLVKREPLKTRFNNAKIFSVAQNDFPKLPSKIKPPTIDELKTMQEKLDRVKKTVAENLRCLLRRRLENKGKLARKDNNKLGNYVCGSFAVGS
jgi:hypothetical protein